MLTEDVDPDYRAFPFRIRTLNDIVIQMFFPTELVETFKDEFEQRLQVLGRRGSDEDVRVRMKDGESD